MALQFIDEKTSKRISHRELLIAFSAVLAIAVNFIFPTKMVGESFWATIFLFLIFPYLIIRFVLKEPLRNFGISLGKLKTGIIFSLAFAILLILAQYFLIYKSGFVNQFNLAPGINSNFAYFLWFEIIIVSVINFCWGFFFRGFLQLGLEEKLGIFSLFLPALANSVLFIREFWFTPLLIFVLSVAAGIITRQSRSVYYSVASLWLISVATDILLVKLVLKG